MGVEEMKDAVARLQSLSRARQLPPLCFLQKQGVVSWEMV